MGIIHFWSITFWISVDSSYFHYSSYIISILKFKYYLFLIILASCSESENSPTRLSTDIFEEFSSGQISQGYGASRGASWGDYDQDGDPDLYVSNASGQWNFFYRNNGNGTFTKLTDTNKNWEAESVIYGGHSQGINWVDYDGDGDLDLFILNRGHNGCFLFRNNNLEEFEKIDDQPFNRNDLKASMACWVDFDFDQDLDVFIAGYGNENSLYENIGEGNFKQIDSDLFQDNAGRARACACADINSDGLPEIFIANARTPNELYLNNGNWDFSRISTDHLSTHVAYSYGASWFDFDQDEDLDLFVANFDKENFLYENQGDGQFQIAQDTIINGDRGGASKGHAWGDYNNDGWIDLYIGNGTYAPEMNNFLYLGTGKGTFRKNMDESILMHADTSAGIASADFDRDGDLDLFVSNWGSSDQKNRLYRNLTSGNNWISFRLRSTDANTYGIGAKVKLFYTHNLKPTFQTRWMYPVTGYASQNDYEIHFGLAVVTHIDSVQVTWNDQSSDVYSEIKINQHHLLTKLGSSIIIQ